MRTAEPASRRIRTVARFNTKVLKAKEPSPSAAVSAKVSFAGLEAGIASGNGKFAVHVGLGAMHGAHGSSGTLHKSAENIHSDDRKVGGEGILASLAVQAIADDGVRALIYTGVRNRTGMDHSALGLAANAVGRLRAPVSHSMLWRGYMPSCVRSPRWSVTQSWRHESKWPVRSCVPLPNNPTSQSTDLSHLELNVVTHLAFGRRNALIGAHMGLAESTLKSYLASAERKLEAASHFDVALPVRCKELIR